MEGLRAYAVLLIFLVHSLPNYALVFRHINFNAYAAAIASIAHQRTVADRPGAVIRERVAVRRRLFFLLTVS